MNINKHRFGLLGEKVATSLSPSLFTWVMARTGVHGSYAIYDFPRRLARTFIAKTSDEWTGLNVTAPHKDLAFELADSLTERAAKVRSVNTLYRDGSKLCGENTDIAGFSFALKKCLETRAKPETILVIGSGGAARACIYVLQMLLPQAELHVATRRIATASERLSSLMSEQDSITVLTRARAVKNLSSYDLVVQATPVGSHLHPGYPLPPPLNFKQDALVMDLIYSPSRTLFLEAASAFGAELENGLVMLIAQGAESFQLWTGVEFPLLTALDELLPEFQRR